MVEEARVAMVLSRSGGGWELQTGYLVAPDLVLTAHHGLGRENEVCFLDRQVAAADVAWSSAEMDVALLRLRGAGRPGVAPIAWASCRGERAAWVGVSFADAGRLDRGEDAARDTVGLSGHVEPGGGLALDRYELVVDAEPSRAEWWKGASGGPVIVANHLVGVVRSVPLSFAGRRLLATPVSRLLEDAELRRMTGEPLLKRLIAGHAGAWTAPQQAPPLSRRHVARPREEAWLRGQLANQHGTLQRVALVGLAGSGKSTLAQAVARSAAVVERFRDGVLWAWVGLRPGMLSLLDGWIQALGDRGFRATEVQTASAHLRTLLADKQCLLVVDDAWADDAELFAAGGERCAILFTTRRADLARRLEVAAEDTLEVGPMDPGPALQLLRRAGPAEGRSSPAEDAIVAAVAEEVGYLPLALELLAGQVQDGRSWGSVLEDLRVHVGLVRATDDPEADEGDLASRSNRSLTASLLLSLAGGPRERIERFAWLGLLAEDASFGATTAAAMWGTDRRTAERELTLLRRASLLLGRGADEAGPVYGLHDVVRDIALEILTRAADDRRLDGVGGGLAVPLAEAHGRLLDRLRAGRDGYAGIADDGYIHDHLIEHLLTAGRLDDVDRLFREANHAGESAWFAARVSSGAFAGFVSDASSVLAHHLAGWRSGQAATEAPLLRYLLVLTSQQLRLPPPLLARLVAEGRWRLHRAEQFVEETTDGMQRAAFHAALARLPGAHRARLALVARDSLLQALESGRGKDPEGETLTLLGVVLADLARAGLGEDVVQIAASFPSAADELPLLVAALPSLRPDERDAVVERSIDLAVRTRAHFRASQWELLAPLLSLEQTIDAIARERDIAARAPADHPYFAGQCLGPLLVQLARCGESHAALRLALELDEVTSRALVLAELAVHAPADRRHELVAWVQAQLRTADDQAWLDVVNDASGPLGPMLQPFYMVAVEQAPQWSESLVRSLAPAIEPADVESWLKELVERAPTGAAAAAIELLGRHVEASLRDELAHRVWLRCSSREQGLPVGASRSLLRAELSTGRRDAIATALMELNETAWSDFGPIATSVLTAMPRASAGILDRIAAGRVDTRNDRLAAIADVLPAEDLDRALRIASVNDDEDERVLARTALAAELRDEEAIGQVLAEVERAVREGRMSYVRSEVLARLAPSLPDELVPAAMRLFGELDWVTSIAEAAAPALFRRTRDTRILDRALEAIETAEDSTRAGAALAAIHPHLSAEHRQRARAWLLAPRPESDGARRVISAIEPVLELAGDEEVAGAFVDAVESVAPKDQLDPLRRSVWRLPPRARARAEAIFSGIAGRSDLAIALCGELGRAGTQASPELVRRLAGLVADLVQRPESGDGVFPLDIVLSRALPLFPDTQLALDAILSLDDPWRRGEALEELAPRLEPGKRIQRAIDGARLTGPPRVRAGALRALARRLRTESPGAALAVLHDAFRASLEEKEAAWLDRETAACAQSLVESGPAAVAEACRGLTTAMVQFSRAHVLGKIFSAAPLLPGGFSRASLRDTFDAIGDVGRFWP